MFPVSLVPKQEEGPGIMHTKSPGPANDWQSIAEKDRSPLMKRTPNLANDGEPPNINEGPNL